MSPQRFDPSPAASAVTLVPSPADTGCSPLRVVGVVRTSSGDPLPGARLDWLPVADEAAPGTDVAAEDAPAGADVARAAKPIGSATTCERGGFDVEVGDSCGHLRVVVRAEGHVPLDVRLVPLPGLQPIMPPITRSSRAPLAVRPGAGNALESWCEFVLEAHEPR